MVWITEVIITTQKEIMDFFFKIERWIYEMPAYYSVEDLEAKKLLWRE